MPIDTSRASIAAALALACASAWGSEAAGWVSKELSFTYQGFTTHYTCDALETKVRHFLLELGARPDLKVRAWGCIEPVAPDTFPGVTVQMSVLDPGVTGGQSVAAHWQRVDLLANRSPAEAAVDCELISQIKLKVLPLFATRNVDYNATCARGQSYPGATHLTADVLVADAAAASASR